MRSSRVARTALLVIGVAAVLPARPGGQAPRFDVASVRSNRAGGAPSFSAMPNGQFSARNVEVRALVLRAFRLHGSQLIGGPDWIATGRFDIEARVSPPPAAGPGALMGMLQTLLAERFQLRTHAETRQLPAHALGLAREERRLGPSIEPSRADCTKGVEAGASLPRPRDGWPPCGGASTRAERHPNGTTTKLTIRRTSISMAEFALSFQALLDRPVIDRTGLSGTFDLEYTYAPEPATLAELVPTDVPVPSLLVAIEEQLGLKLREERTGIPVLVIDSVERPSEN